MDTHDNSVARNQDVEEIFAQVLDRPTTYSVFSLEKLATLDNLPPAPAIRIEGEEEEGFKLRTRNLRRRALFPGGVASALARLIHDRHGGPCDTDDAELYVELGLPFVIEWAELTGRSAIITGLAWVAEHCPAYANGRDTDAAARLIHEMLGRRDEASFRRAEQSAPFPLWLPPMSLLRRELRPTWDEVTRLRMRGWQAIDRPPPEELKMVKADRQRQARRERGVAAMSSRTITTDLKVIADEIGVSLRTMERWKKAGTLEQKVAEKRVGNLRLPNTYLRQGFTFPTSPEAANDDIEDTNRRIREHGFHGQNITVSPKRVAAVEALAPEVTDLLDYYTKFDADLGELAAEWAAEEAQLQPGRSANDDEATQAVA